MNWENEVNKDGNDMAANEDQKIFIGRRPARETPRNQGGGRAKRNSCQGLNEVDGEKMGCPLKFGGLVLEGSTAAQQRQRFLAE